MNPELSGADPDFARKILTVAELNRAVGALLERHFPLLWVSGEISNLTRAASGHWYFSLKDRDAQVRCVMFRNRNQAVAWVPREGDHVEARVLVGLYAPRGDFQLTVEQLRRAGAGTLFEAFLRTKARLEAAGLFDPARKRALPTFPIGIGVVTSLQAAALRDVLTALARRAPYLPVVVYPTVVQGSDAPQQIALAIATASRRSEIDAIDVLLVVRGGGSIEDLWAYNDEIVARAIAESSIPVVAGVGHETDFTIADFVADIRAATPTAAAELASPDGMALANRIVARRAALGRALERRFATATQCLDEAVRRLKSPIERWVAARDAVRALGARFYRVGRAAMADHAQRMGVAIGALRRVRPDLNPHVHRHARARDELRTSIGRVQAQAATRLESLAQRLLLLDPKAILGRGYAIATDAAGATIRDAAVLSPGARLRVEFARGRVDSTVIAIDGNPAAPSPIEQRHA